MTKMDKTGRFVAYYILVRKTGKKVSNSKFRKEK